MTSLPVTHDRLLVGSDLRLLVGSDLRLLVGS
jgi:hypothetical protein